MEFGLQIAIAANSGVLIAAIIIAIAERCHRVGGLVFFRFGRVGGSIYIARRPVAAPIWPLV